MNKTAEIYPIPSLMDGRWYGQRYGIFCGVQMQKSWAEMFQIEVLLNRGKFSRIIELGTGTGGTTLMLGVQGMTRNIKVYSYDIGSTNELQFMSDEVKQVLKSLNVNYVECDVFEREDEIRDIINQEGRVLLYNDCGGGKDDGKRKASLMFGKMLKSDDVMLVHDYNTNEFCGDDVEHTKKECGFANYEQEWLDQFNSKHGAFVKI